MIFITGDIHGSHDIHKFSTSLFPMKNELSRSDYMIICGDFGLVWSNSAEERYWLKWLDSKPWTTLWIDGNHENFDLLKEYPIEDWHGGRVQKITENIIHLCRGNVFELEGRIIFALAELRAMTKSTASSDVLCGSRRCRMRRKWSKAERLLNPITGKSILFLPILFPRIFRRICSKELNIAETP